MRRCGVAVAVAALGVANAWIFEDDDGLMLLQTQAQMQPANDPQFNDWAKTPMEAIGEADMETNLVDQIRREHWQESVSEIVDEETRRAQWLEAKKAETPEQVLGRLQDTADIDDTADLDGYFKHVRGQLNMSARRHVQITKDFEMKFFSVQIVQNTTHNNIVALAVYAEYDWLFAQNSSLECVFEDGRTTELNVHAHENNNVPYPKAIEFFCQLATDAVLEAPNKCQKVRFQQKGATADSDDNVVEVCNGEHVKYGEDKDHYLSACVPIPYEDPAYMAKSGFKQLPQWLEYHAMHGVDHFLFYILSDKDDHKERMLNIAHPFLKAGMGSVVELTGMGDIGPDWEIYHAMLANDCMYRLKHRTHWLMATIDSDEYLHFEGEKNLADGLRGIEKDSEHLINSVSFPRYQYMVPKDSKALQLTSDRRENKFANLCPKYILQPDNVYTLFIHWTVSKREGSKTVIPGGDIWAAHYRLDDSTVIQKKIILVEDAAMAGEVTELQTRMVERYGDSGIEDLMLTSSVKEVKLGSVSNYEHKASAASDVTDWVQRVNKKLADDNEEVCKQDEHSEAWSCGSLSLLDVADMVQ